MRRSCFVSQGLSEEAQHKCLKELQLGFLNLEDEMFEQADLNFSVALKYDKNCAEAYWGKTLTKFQIKSEDLLYIEPVKYQSVLLLPECQKALELANESQKKIYQNILEKIYLINQGENY